MRRLGVFPLPTSLNIFCGYFSMIRSGTFFTLAIFAAWISPTATAQDVKPAPEKAVKNAGSPRKKQRPRSRRKAPTASWRLIFSRKFPKKPRSTKPSATTTWSSWLATDPNYQWAKDITYRHDIWQLEFEFKPMRMIYVDIPQSSGKMQRKLIWYLVYTVKNTGKVLVPTPDKMLPYEKDLTDKKKVYRIKEETKPIRFVPEFLLEGCNRMKVGEGFTKAYPRSGDTRRHRADSVAGGSEPEIAYHGGDVQGGRRRRNSMGRSDLGRYRSANRAFFGLRDGLDQRLPVERRPRRVQGRRSRWQGAATLQKKR